MPNINKIRLSGTTYTVQDENACKVVELTQAEYDALPATAKTSNSLFIITDAQGADLSNYYTKTEADGLLDTKLDVSAYTPTDLSNYYTKSETSGATEISTALASKADTATTYTKTETDNAITAATSTKQDTLVSGTNIKTINNQSILGEGNIDIQGGSGGSSYTAGDGIDITNDVISVTGKVDTSAFTAHTADTVIHVTSDEKAAWNDKQDTLVSGTNIKTINNQSILGEGNITIEGGSGGGKAISAGTNISVTTGETADTINCTLPIEAINNAYGISQIYVGDNIYKNNNYEAIVIASKDDSSTGQTRVEFAHGAISIGSSNKVFQNGIVIGSDSTAGASNSWNHIAIGYNTVATGTTKTNINNQIKVDDSNQVYIYNKDNTEMICLQDALGGGGGTVDTEITSASTNPVTSAAIYNQFGGLKLVKLTQSEYDSLTTKNSSTLYIING